MIFPNLEICAVGDVDKYANRSLTHLISIRNPRAPSARPAWFRGPFLEMFFGDVVSENDAKACRTLPPTVSHIKEALNFTSKAFSVPSSKTLIFCDYGASRSPALAYTALAANAPTGAEGECLERIIRIRPDSVPNMYIVRLADHYLSRKGALLTPCQSYVRKLFQDLS